MVKSLTKKSFYGRGYYKNGVQKAGKWIAKEMDRLNLKKVNQTRLQYFSHPVVKFEGRVSLKINSHSLQPGIDFIVHAASLPLKRKNIRALFITSQILQDTVKLKSLFDTLNFQHFVLILDTIPPENISKTTSTLYKLSEPHFLYGFVFLVKKLPPWWASPHIMSIPTFSALYSDQWKWPSSKISFETGSSYEKDYISFNVMGMVEGTLKQDSFLIITAHYDHLGQMGKKALFPGANDNAAGVAMLLDLANYYQINPPKYSIIFIAFAAEEVGLVGSEFYTLNPMHPLNKTRFLLNLDLIATGETGMTVVNGLIFKEEFKLLNDINDSLKLLPNIAIRGNAKNSDHYYFTELNIPSFFCYLSGNRNAYHSIDDIYNTITFPKYIETFTLFREFFSKLQQ